MAEWTWQKGWRGLIPSVSTLEDTQLAFGQPSAVSELVNGITYDFLQGGVRVTFLSEDPTISKIWIKGTRADLVPPNMVLMQEAFGELSPLRIDRTDGMIYHRPGMRVCADPSKNPETTMWVEMFRD